MEKLQLISPTVKLQQQFYEMLKEWRLEGNELIPWTIALNTSNFSKYVNTLLQQSKGLELPEGFVPHSSFWLVNEQLEILGTSNLRHSLNEKLLKLGGNIGYGIKPSARRKGYATKLLELTLLEAKKLGIEKALITCDKGNIGSAKTIQKNGGILWKEEFNNGRLSQYYWVEIQ